MVKTIYLVRHAEGQHNVNASYHIRDPILTPLGRSQCQALNSSFPFHDEVEIVLASPMRRTIETAIFSFAPILLKPQVSFLLVPHAQEISAAPCDTGHEREELEHKIEEVLTEAKLDKSRIDYSILESGWTGNTGIHEASLEAVERRAAALRSWLWKRPEQSIVLTTHGAFLHYLTEDWAGYSTDHGTAYKNCEYRRFTFTDSSTEEDAHLVEIGGMGTKLERPFGVHAHVITGVPTSNL